MTSGFSTLKINNISFISGSQNYYRLLEKSTKNIRLMSARTEKNFYYALVPENEIIPLLKSKNCAIAELLTHYPKKLYFDIDIKDGSKTRLKDIMNVLNKYFDSKGYEDWNVSGYENNDIKSYHIVHSRYTIDNEDELLKLKKLALYIKKTECAYIDEAVYSKNRHMKCVHQGKPNSPVQEILCGWTTDDKHIIGSFFGNNTISFTKNKKFIENYIPELETTQSKPYETVHKLPEYISKKDLQDARKLLELTPSDNNLDHGHRWKVALFCYYNGITEEEYMNWFLKSSPSEIRTKKVKKFWDELPKFENYKVSVDNFRKYLGNFIPELLDDNHFTPRFLSSFEFNEDIKVRMIDRIKNKHFNKRRVSLFNIGMGGGKTTSTLQYLKDNDDKSFIWLAPRQTLVSNTSHRMKNEIIIKHLSHLDLKKDKSPLTTAKELLICNQSLHYLPETKKYDIVVIDEIETVLNCWTDEETHKENLGNNFKVFCNVIRNANKIILLDAFITTKTTNFINNIGIENKEMILYNSKYSPEKKKINHNKDFMEITNKIAKEVREGKKLYIFYAFKNGTKNSHYSIIQMDLRIKEIIKQMDIDSCNDLEKIKEINKIPTQDYKKSLLYYAESKEKNQLGDVNKLWKEADYILTTSSITVGVNYEGLDYDKIYLLCSGISNNPRDIIQSSMRIRKPTTNIIELFCFDYDSKNLIEYPKYYHNNDVVYRSLVQDIYTELQCDFNTSFRKFCELTNYDVSKVPELKYDKKRVRNQFVNDMFVSRMLLDYDNVPEITDDLIQEYEEKMYQRSATLSERLSIDRFYMDKTFRLLEKDERQVIWNNRGKQFFKGINHEVIEKIKEDNEISSLGELNFNDLEVSDNTKEYIKENFSTIIKQKTNLIVKTLNQVLGINAVETVKSKNKNITGHKFSELFVVLNELNDKMNNIKNERVIDFVD